MPIVNAVLVRKLLKAHDTSKEALALNAMLDKGLIFGVLNYHLVSDDVVMHLLHAFNDIYGESLTFDDLVLEPSDSGSQATMIQDLIRDIPEQSPIVRFGISENSKLILIPTGVENNDYDTIEVFRDELLDTGGPIEVLLYAYSVRNVPQAELYPPLLLRYRNELYKDVREINYTRLYAIGSRIMAARKKAQVEEANGEWPAPGPIEAEAIEAVCKLHGPLIMASESGRKLVTDAHQFEVPPEVYREEEELISEFGAKLAEATEIIEDETSEAISEFSSQIPNDEHVARNRGLKLSFAHSALVAFVGGAAWLSAGGAANLGGLALLGSSMFAWEVVKKTNIFKTSTESLANELDELAEVRTGHNRLLNRVSTFVAKNRDIFERVSRLRPEFLWAERIITDPKLGTKRLNIAPDFSKQIRVIFASNLVDKDAATMRFLIDIGKEITAKSGGDIKFEVINIINMHEEQDARDFLDHEDLEVEYVFFISVIKSEAVSVEGARLRFDNELISDDTYYLDTFISIDEFKRKSNEVVVETTKRIDDIQVKVITDVDLG